MDWQTMHLPLAAGMNQKADPRALMAPELAKCVNVQFDEVGGLQTRYPYAALGSDIFGGGTIANARRVVANGNELLLFTKDTLYSWNAQLSKWVAKGTHLAVKVEEQAVFVTTGEQTECDRAELNGTVVYCWKQVFGASSKGYVAAVDKTTGAVLMAPTALPGSAARLRVTALTTKILLSFYDGIAGLYAYALDPASPATALAGASTTLTNTNFGQYYDITRVLGADQAVFACRRTPTTSYLVGTVTAAMVVATSTKVRVCTDAIAVSSTPDGASVQVVRTDAANVVGDLITIATLVDVYTAQAIGTAAISPISQVTAAHRSVVDGAQYRCYAFWRSVSGVNTVKTNYVDTGGVLGAQSTMVTWMSIGSRAFNHDGRVFVNLIFDEVSAVSTPYLGYSSAEAALQNTYFLHRDDGFLTAKILDATAGGAPATASHLPNVVAGSDGAIWWCATERRIVPTDGGNGAYADRGPRDVALTFDSNEARRCVRLGQTFYITGGEILQYDGSQLVEVGFHVAPFGFTLAAAAGSMVAGVYAYKASARWQGATGDVDRSTSATSGAFQITGVPAGVNVIINFLAPTHRDDASLEIWRTPVNPVDDSPFYLVTDLDPVNASTTNGYIKNNPDGVDYSFFDALTDAVVLDRQSNLENGGFLENLAPPAATIIIASDTRLFLAGVAGDPDRVWYSKQRQNGEVASFHEVLTVNVPSSGGPITGLAFLQETLLVFRETAIYAMPGDGFDNAGNGQNLGPAREISADIGAVNQESIAVTDKGVVFKSSKGWYLLSKGFALEYIGGAISDYDALDPVAVDVLESQHQIRIVVGTIGFAPVEDGETALVIPGYYSRTLVLDTLVGQWSEWTVRDAVHACIWSGTHVYIAAAAANKQLTTYTGVTYGLDIETAWIKLADLQGFGRVRRFEVLGEYLSAHRLRVRVARDYWKDGVDTYFQDKTWTVSPTTVGGPLQVKHGPSIQQMSAIKIRLTAIGPITDPPTGEALKLTGLGLELGFARGLNRHLAATRKQ